MPETARSYQHEDERAGGKRAAIVIALITVVLSSLWFLPALVFNLGVAAVVVLAAREFYLLDSSVGSTPVYRWLGMSGAGLVALQMVFFPAVGSGLSISLFVLLLFSILVLRTREPNARELYEVLVVTFGVIYTAGMFGQLILIRNLTAGRELTVVLFLAVFAREVGAHFGGSLFPSGKLLNSSINPKKSYQGGAVGVAAAVGTAILLSRYLNVHFTLLRAAMFGGCIGIVCQLGDFSESYIKRVARQRHSSRWLGPEGGILDFLDAVGFAIVAARVMLLVWGYSR
jgi:phosphatidate cytidylyltransferase